MTDKPCEPDCQGYADYAAVPCPNPACDDRVRAQLKAHALAGVEPPFRAPPAVGMVVCDCRYLHLRVTNVDDDGDTLTLEDGSMCSYAHCCDDADHPWTHPTDTPEGSVRTEKPDP